MLESILTIREVADLPALLQAYAVEKARLEADGRTFAEVLAERRPAGAITAKVEA